MMLKLIRNLLAVKGIDPRTVQIRLLELHLTELHEMGGMDKIAEALGCSADDVCVLLERTGDGSLVLVQNGI